MCKFLVSLLALSFLATVSPAQSDRWTDERANDWYARQPWFVGSNYIPSNAINQLEMWQPDTFDPQRIDLELSWAEGIGLNSMRVFLHYFLWEQDPLGFRKRLDTFLAIANSHHIKIMFVLFDSCWDPNPHLGPQHPPRPGVHNSGWVQSPGAAILQDPTKYPGLQKYVQDVLTWFGNDPRVIVWDLWNEPSNTNEGSYNREEPDDKKKLVTDLLPKVFAWAHEANPSQPLTSGLWEGNWSSPKKLDPIARIQFEESDVLSFHDYEGPGEFRKHMEWLLRYHRPVFCTEYMARPRHSTFAAILPIAKANKVAALNWGLVAGKTQTYLPWDSWLEPYITREPKEWFHDIFHADGAPYRQSEVDFIRNITGTSASPQ
jgi:hypothetical protein